MRKKNRFVSFLLAAALCLGLLSVAWAVPAVIDSGELSAGLTWELTNDGKLTISGDGPMPDWTNGGDQPWSGLSTQIQSVTIGDGVTKIGKHAFEGCASLKSVTIRPYVTEIGNSAFYHCTNLESVTIPHKVTRIEELSFFSART